MAAIAALAGVVACSPARSPDPKAMFPPGCGLPTPRPDARPGRLPAPFLLDDLTELVRVQKRPGGLVAAINVALGVAPAWERYKEASRAAGFSIVGTDNEGFEAEIYLRSDEDLGAVQIRTSACDHVSLVFVSLVSIEQSASTPFLPTPTPTTRRDRRR